jgi:hypothetical protein
MGQCMLQQTSIPVGETLAEVRRRAAPFRLGGVDRASVAWLRPR